MELAFAKLPKCSADYSCNLAFSSGVPRLQRLAGRPAQAAAKPFLDADLTIHHPMLIRLRSDLNILNPRIGPFRLEKRVPP